MPSSLRSRLEELSAAFVAEVLTVIRSASIDELVSESSGPTDKREHRAAPKGPRASRGVSSSGRLRRRSKEDVEAILQRVLALVARHKTGLRAEQIKQELDLQAKEMPRVLKEGLAKKKLSSRGQKRATTYFAKGGGWGGPKRRPGVYQGEPE
jgi:hypothetical protein